MKRPRVKRRKSTTGKRRGFYVIPSLFTVANIFCGFLSIVASSRGQFERASILILIAIFADVLDGRIARLTGTVTQFGEEFDSLADVTSFGVAPALLAFQWGLWDVPRVGMAVAFLFLVAGSIRLARFSATDSDSLDFIGLPIPAGAGSIAMLVLTSPSPVTHPAFIPVVVAFVLGLSLLMVSNLPYPSFKGCQPEAKMASPYPLSRRPCFFAHYFDASFLIDFGRHLHHLGAGHGPDTKGTPQTGRCPRASFKPWRYQRCPRKL